MKYDLTQYCFSEADACVDGTPRLCGLRLFHDGACEHVREDVFFTDGDPEIPQLGDDDAKLLRLVSEIWEVA